MNAPLLISVLRIGVTLLLAICVAANLPLRAAEGLSRREPLTQNKMLAIYFCMALQEYSLREENINKTAGAHFEQMLMSKAGVEASDLEKVSELITQTRQALAPIDRRARYIIRAARQDYPTSVQISASTPPETLKTNHL